jgi:hypothetical protein
VAETRNILTPQEKCRVNCSRTFATEHGASMPGGPFPGTFGEEGSVRRCEHGRVWQWLSCEFWRIDIWAPLSPFWSPVRYWRAVRALAAPASKESE